MPQNTPTHYRPYISLSPHRSLIDPTSTPYLSLQRSYRNIVWNQSSLSFGSYWNPRNELLSHVHISQFLIDFRATRETACRLGSAVWEGKRSKKKVTNFNFLLRISIHRKERRLLEIKNDRLLWGKWFDLLSNHPKSWVLEGDYVIKISFENNSIFFFNFCRENTNLLQILTKLCFLEKMSMKSKNERWKIMKKTFITVI